MSDDCDKSGGRNEWKYELPGVTLTTDDAVGGGSVEISDFGDGGPHGSHMLSLNDCLSAFNDSSPPLEYSIHNYPSVNDTQESYVELINGVILHNSTLETRKLPLLSHPNNHSSINTDGYDDSMTTEHDSNQQLMHSDYQPNNVHLPQHLNSAEKAFEDARAAGLPPHPYADDGMRGHFPHMPCVPHESQFDAPHPHAHPVQPPPQIPNLAQPTVTPSPQPGYDPSGGGQESVPPLSAALAHAFDSLVNSPPFIKFLTDRNQMINPSEVPHETLKIKSQALRKSNKTQAEIAMMSPDARRKYERNQREKQRSFKISKQIKDLQEVLTSLQIPYKNNKFSVLMSAVDFISEIQRENSNAVMHNAAMKNILVQANEFLKRLKEGGNDATDLTSNTTHPTTDLYTNFTANMHRKTPLDYGYIFKNVAVPMGIAKPDGKIADCNDEFVSTTGYEREELLGKDISVVLDDPIDKSLQKMFSEEGKRSLDESSSEGSPAPVMPISRKRLKIKESHNKSNEVQLGIDIAPVQDDKGKCKHFTFTAVQLVG
ncbi:hypothetical protein TrVE_jg10058 [Triparma verrucosa]|uniref:BHLH domain-containing protein n=1 Tax=Triparma verrucosa TaxID=1606542 RepID=A0A9W7DQS2_9STRA|nr:hypothetical protein TrVE_jg10058 [Triparma verrucosa]